MTSILGIKPTMSNAWVNTWGRHDPSACLVRDGEIVAAVEEERFNRVKRGGGPCFPTESVKYVLDKADQDISDIDAIAIGRDHKKYAEKLRRKPTSLLPNSLGSVHESIEQVSRALGAYTGVPIKQVSQKIEEIFEKEFGGQWYEIPHHRAHAASAAYCSSFEDQLTLTIDGCGEVDSTVVWDSELNRIKEFPETNSIGLFYDAGCKYLGFRPGRDAGKVMGLASYGEYRKEFEEYFDELTSVGEGTYDVSNVQPDDIGPIKDRFGPRRIHPEDLTQRHKDFAYHLQRRTEQIVSKLIRHYVSESDKQNVSLAGGVAMNCKMNREISDMECVDNLFIQPAANDSGIGLGAALEGYRKATGETPDADLENVYFGPEYSSEQIRSITSSAKLDVARFEDEEISRRVAELLADGKLVGWFQGRMELGARALGNRSILADPTSKKSLDRVNINVKHREEWRPFAPSLLYEAKDEYLVSGDESPYMILLDSIKESKQDEVPAVTHVDGTTRPQTVRKSQNPKYHKLISEFEAITGTPVLLNTSFNVAGEPIVESPEQAIADFYTTGLDALALGNHLLTKPSLSSE